MCGCVAIPSIECIPMTELLNRWDPEVVCNRHLMLTWIELFGSVKHEQSFKMLSLHQLLRSTYIHGYLNIWESDDKPDCWLGVAHYP